MPTFSTTNHALQFGTNNPTVSIYGSDIAGTIIYMTSGSFYEFAPNTKYFALQVIFTDPYIASPVTVTLTPANTYTEQIMTAQPSVGFFVDVGIGPGFVGSDVTATYFNISGVSASTAFLGPSTLAWYYEVNTGIPSGGGGGGSLGPSGVTPGSYTAASIIVDAYGIITSASNGIPSFSSKANNFLQVNSGGTAIQWITLNADMLAPAWTLSISGPSSPIELGATLTNPSFTASYNRTAAAASLDDGSGSIALTVSPFTSFAYGTAPLPARSYTKTTINATVTWTLTGNETGGPSKTATTAVQWQPRIYWDVITPPGTYDSTFISSLTNSGLKSSFQTTIAFGAGGGTKHLVYVFPASYGTPTIFKDVSTGFGVPFSKVASAVPFINGFGASISGGYDVWLSDNALVAAVTVQVS